MDTSDIISMLNPAGTVPVQQITYATPNSGNMINKRTAIFIAITATVVTGVVSSMATYYYMKDQERKRKIRESLYINKHHM